MARSNNYTSMAQRQLANMAFASGVIVIGSTTTAITTSVAIPYSLDGFIYSRTALTNQALAKAADYTRVINGVTTSFTAPAIKTQPANTTVYYVLALDASQTVSAWQGTYEGEVIADPTGVSIYGDGSIPQVPEGFTPFAVIKVASGGSIFLLGTTSLGTGGQSSGGVATLRNISTLPVGDTF